MKVLNKIKECKFYLFFLIIGLILFACPMLTSGFQSVPGDLTDSRFITYILEHYYCWILQEPSHQAFWNAPFFYPLENTMAYSDLLLGLAFIYVPLRFLINNPFTIFQILFVAVCILNYTSFYLLLKKIFKFKDFSCSCGAFLFAFSLTLYSQINHLQLFTQFYAIFTILFFYYGIKSNTRLKKYSYYSLSALFLVVQTWTGFYLAYFLVFGSILGFIISISFQNSRDLIFKWLKNDYKILLVNCIIAFIFVLPLAIHYLGINAKYTLETILSFKLHFINLFQSTSFVDNFLLPFTKNHDIERNFGCGIFTTFVAILGLWRFKNFRKQIFIFIIGIICIFSFIFLIKILYYVFPPACAIRAIYRIVFMIYPLLALGFAKFIEDNKCRKFLLIIILSLFLIEQIPSEGKYMFSKKEHEERISQYNVGNNCREILLFYMDKTGGEYSSEYELDAMWLSLKYNMPTYNGYSGIIPYERKIDIIHPPCVIKAK